MKRTWLLAFLFLTLWQMLPHEGYNMLYAQGMGEESYGGGYDCEDDLGPYSSSLPCDQTPCVTPCPACHVTYACDEIDNHTCPADNITCSSCGESMTPEQYLNHTCSNQNEEERCAICGRTIDQCSCEGPVITPNNPSVPPSNPFSGGETHTGGGSGNNSSSSNSSSNNSNSNTTNTTTYNGAKTFVPQEIKAAIKHAVEETKRRFGSAAACNIGVQIAAKQVIGYLPSSLNGRANDIATNLQSSNEWMNITVEQVGTFASNGCFVVGVWKNTSGRSGHIVLAYPDNYSNTNNDAMKVMDTGPTSPGPGKNECQEIKNSFGRNKLANVKYYVYKGNQ